MHSTILGVGIDLCELDRIAGLLERQGDAFLRRAYTSAEIVYITENRSPARRCAVLFAAKEAIVKCLGTGFASGVSWKQVEVIPAGPARPVTRWKVFLHGEALRHADAHGITEWNLDIHPGRGHVAAVAVWSRTGKGMN